MPAFRSAEESGLKESGGVMNQFNIGIVGLGWVAGAHIEAFKSVEGAAVTAVCSRRQLDESDLEKEYGLPLKTYQKHQTHEEHEQYLGFAHFIPP